MSIYKDKIKNKEINRINILNPDELFIHAQESLNGKTDSFAKGVAGFFNNIDLSLSEKNLGGKIILNLIKQAEIDLKEALSDRLSIEENIPSEVINFLASDNISVAEKVLIHSPVLTETDLLYIISFKGKDHWRSIAKRTLISDAIINKLIETNDKETALNIVSNDKNSLKEDIVKKLIINSISHEDLQRPLLRRPEIDSNLAISLYMCVSNELKKEITNRFYIPIELLEMSIGELVEELSVGSKGDYKISEDMLIIAKRFNEKNLITVDLMIKTLRHCQMSFFIAIFAEKINFNHEDVLTMLKNSEGKLFALSCKSLGMMKSEFASIFLLSRKIRNNNALLREEDISATMKYFNQIDNHDILKTMNQCRENPELI